VKEASTVGAVSFFDSFSYSSNHSQARSSSHDYKADSACDRTSSSSASVLHEQRSAFFSSSAADVKAVPPQPPAIPKTLSEEDRARIENNRRLALEKLKQKQEKQQQENIFARSAWSEDRQTTSRHLRYSKKLNMSHT
jgi:hypothetical protein